MKHQTLAAFVLLCAPMRLPAQTRTFTHADTLRGSSTTPARAWWDVTFYDLRVAISPTDSSLRGSNGISYRVLQPSSEMQIDLMIPLDVDSMVQDSRAVPFRRDGNAFFAQLAVPQPAGATKTITVFYHGKPQPARRPPWDGGFTWTSDSLGRTWVVTTDQGLGASVWWPNKDTQADEPDSQRIALTVPDGLIDVANGRLRRTSHNADGTTTYEWFVVNPINNYAIAVAAGNYAHFSDTLLGERGPLTLDIWVHEGFANYAENLYTECLFGRDSGAAYVIGTRRGIKNDIPIVGPYGVNADGSGDRYPKGGNLLHTIRQIVGDDEKWRGILRGLNKTFWHQTVTGAQIEAYISEHAGTGLTKVFDQYLRTTMVPVLEYRIEGNTLHYRWTNVVPGFAMPVRVTLAESGFSVIRPTEAWKTARLKLAGRAFAVDPNYYVTASPL